MTSPAEHAATQSGPAQSDGLTAEQRKTRALAQLRQSAWEATQYLATGEVVAYVESVMREVERDEP